MKSKKSASWSNVKARLSSMDRAGLTGVIRDLYEASSANRRFLHARFVPAAATLDEYRKLVGTAVFPDPLSQRPIRLREAAAIVDAGTEQAADLGYGDETYFATLERKAKEAVAMLEALPDEARDDAVARLVRLVQYQDKIGWGYGDFLADIATQWQRKRRQGKSARAIGRHPF